MKKTMVLFLALIVLLSALTSCIKSPWRDQIIEEALIERIFTNSIHIQVTYEDGTLQHYNINVCDDVRWNGEQIALSDLHVGDRIRVTYDGAVVELYPALIEGTTKIELLEDAITPPTSEISARVESIDGEKITVRCWEETSDDHIHKTYALTITDDIRIVKNHHVTDASVFFIGSIIHITYRGELTNTPEIIRIEQLERVDLN